MKIKINRNILWSETFIKKLNNLGVKHACVSPGSRNTPLTIALANNRQIKTYVHIDERSSGFFALGLARATNSPVVLVCTSGTAAAEFYPAIIEAYQQRIPLIVCTADRPPELIGRGANQTIYQDNIYKNHIRWFINAGLPEPTADRLEFLCRLAERAVLESTKESRGPVHINFPFRKPFEPFLFTDEVDESLANISDFLKTQIFKSVSQNSEQLNSKEDLIPEIFKYIRSSRRGLIIAGPGNYTDSFAEKCNNLALQLNYPIIADGTSQLRFSGSSKENILVNFEGYMRSEKFLGSAEPEIIIQFGRTPTSKGMEIFFEGTRAPYYIINEYGEWHDPFNKARAVLNISPEYFCEKILSMFRYDKDAVSAHEDKQWLSDFQKAECTADEIKKGIINNAPFPFEGRIITELIELMPDSSVLMVSNSMPVRDLDYFAPKSDKSIKVFQNRGASGIDGITSTALGIAEGLNKLTVLLTGDLAFYYDLNGMLASMKYSIPLVVVLINNNGGGIFEMLPVAKCDDVFNDFFITPHNLDFSHFVKGYGGNFEEVKSWEHFREVFKDAIGNEKLSVIQINTNAKESVVLRKQYWTKVGENI